jgi:hypothetical protein
MQARIAASYDILSNDLSGIIRKYKLTTGATVDQAAQTKVMTSYQHDMLDLMEDSSKQQADNAADAAKTAGNEEAALKIRNDETKRVRDAEWEVLAAKKAVAGETPAQIAAEKAYYDAITQGQMQVAKGRAGSKDYPKAIGPQPQQYDQSNDPLAIAINETAKLQEMIKKGAKVSDVLGQVGSMDTTTTLKEDTDAFKAFFSNKIKLAKDNGDDYRKVVKANEDMLLNVYGEDAEKHKAIEAAANKAITENHRYTAQKIVDAWNTISGPLSDVVNNIGDLFSTISDAVQASAQQQLDDLDANGQAEIEQTLLTAQQKADIQKQAVQEYANLQGKASQDEINRLVAAKAKELSYSTLSADQQALVAQRLADKETDIQEESSKKAHDLAVATKVLQIAMATANTFAAAAAVFAAEPGELWTKVAAAATAVATGLGLVSQIASVSIPSAATGGSFTATNGAMVEGSPMVIPATSHEDAAYLRVNGGETATITPAGVSANRSLHITLQMDRQVLWDDWIDGARQGEFNQYIGRNV